MANLKNEGPSTAVLSTIFRLLSPSMILFRNMFSQNFRLLLAGILQLPDGQGSNDHGHALRVRYQGIACSPIRSRNFPLIFVTFLVLFAFKFVSKSATSLYLDRNSRTLKDQMTMRRARMTAMLSLGYFNLPVFRFFFKSSLLEVCFTLLVPTIK